MVNVTCDFQLSMQHYCISSKRHLCRMIIPTNIYHATGASSGTCLGTFDCICSLLLPWDLVIDRILLSAAHVQEVSWNCLPEFTCHKMLMFHTNTIILFKHDKEEIVISINMSNVKEKATLSILRVDGHIHPSPLNIHQIPCTLRHYAESPALNPLSYHIFILCAAY